MGCLNTKGGIVGNHPSWCNPGLSKGRTNDAIIRDFRVQTMLDQEVALNPIDFNLHGSIVGFVVDTHWLCQRATCFFAQIFDRAKCRARRSTDVVHASFESVQLFNNSKRNHNIATNKIEHAHWICNKNRSVKHNSSSSRSHGIGWEQTAIGLTNRKILIRV